MYICFEGIDGCGKSTLARAIFEQYQQRGVSVILTKEPGSTPLGQQVRSMVQYADDIDIRAEFLLYAADRAHHYTHVIAPALHAGTTIVSDRSFVSSIAYQGYGRGLDIALITEINTWVMHRVVPDVFVYLDIDPALAYQRIHARAETVTRFEQEKTSFFSRVIQGYDDIFKQYSQVIRLDACKTQEELLQECIEALYEYEKR